MFEVISDCWFGFFSRESKNMERSGFLGQNASLQFLLLHLSPRVLKFTVCLKHGNFSCYYFKTRKPEISSGVEAAQTWVWVPWPFVNLRDSKNWKIWLQLSRMIKQEKFDEISRYSWEHLTEIVGSELKWKNRGKEAAAVVVVSVSAGFGCTQWSTPPHTLSLPPSFPPSLPRAMRNGRTQG